MNLGPVEIQRVSDLSDVFAVVIAATRVHDSLYHGPAAAVATLPPQLREAFIELQAALQRLTHPASVVWFGTGDQAAN